MFTQQTYELPERGTIGPKVGDFSSDTQPDVLGQILATAKCLRLDSLLSPEHRGEWEVERLRLP